jgi:hypothetical protein
VAASQPAGSAPASFEAGRVACLTGADGGTRAYAVIVHTAADDPATAQALLDTLSDRLEIKEP